MQPNVEAAKGALFLQKLKNITLFLAALIPAPYPKNARKQSVFFAVYNRETVNRNFTVKPEARQPPSRSPRGKRRSAMLWLQKIGVQSHHALRFIATERHKTAVILWRSERYRMERQKIAVVVAFVCTLLNEMQTIYVRYKP